MRFMRIRTKVILAVVAVSIITVSIIMGYRYYAPDSWGADGELSLLIDGDTINMTLNDTPNMTYRLTNIGNTDLRVFWGYPCIRSQLNYFTNNTTVKWVGPVAAPPPASYFNNDRLIVIKAHESIVDTAQISLTLWDIKNNETYGFFIHYRCVSSYPLITHPYWKGELWSNQVKVNVS
jgi:hypothetical protein